MRSARSITMRLDKYRVGLGFPGRDEFVKSCKCSHVRVTDLRLTIYTRVTMIVTLTVALPRIPWIFICRSKKAAPPMDCTLFHKITSVKAIVGTWLSGPDAAQRQQVRWVARDGSSPVIYTRYNHGHVDVPYLTRNILTVRETTHKSKLLHHFSLSIQLL